MFTPQELQVIAQLIQLAPIKGADAVTVAVLLQKIAKLLEPKQEKEDAPKKK